MQFRILGSLEVADHGSPLCPGGPREQRLLAALLLDANRVVPLHRLIDTLWEDTAPATAEKQVRNVVSRLRGALSPAGDPRISAAGAGYRIATAEDQLDASVFNAETARAEQAAAAGALAQAADHLKTALGLWRGPVLAGMPGAAIETAARAWNERHLATQERHADLLLALGRASELLADLTEVVANHPLRQNPVGQLMLALHRCARQADALALYTATRKHLAEQLGLDPSPALQRLHHQILTDDPALAPPVPPARGPTGAAAQAEVTVPRQLPAATRQFVGRGEQLKYLDRLLDTENPIGGMVVISAIGGAAGVGKTALALQWAHRAVHRFPDGQLYVNLRGFDPAAAPVDPAHALRGFLRSLAVDPRRIPSDLEAQTALYRSLLAGRRMLVLLDNANDADQVRPLLPGERGCTVLVTSRNRLAGLTVVDGAHPVALDPMTSAEGMELMACRLGAERVAAEPDAAHELLDLCARLPLALSIAAARAALDPAVPLTDLAAQMRDTRDRLDVLNAGDPATDIRAVFFSSYRVLSPRAAAMLRALGVHPGPDISVAAAASLTALTRAQAERTLGELTRLHLVGVPIPNRYALHDLLRLYAAEQALAEPSSRDEVTLRMLDHYTHTTHTASLMFSPQRAPVPPDPPAPGTLPERITEIAQALDWCEREHDVLLAVTERAAADGFDDHAWRIPWALAHYLDRRGHWAALITTQHTALDAARRLGDAHAQARSHAALSRAYVRQGEYDAAHRHYRAAFDLFAQLGRRADQARTLLNTAEAFAGQERYDQALDSAKLALEMFRELDDTSAQADALNATGWYHTLSGNHLEALTCCTQALALHRELDDQVGQASTLDSLGMVHHNLGQHPEAIDCYRRSAHLADRLGDRYHHAVTLAHLGDTHHTAGNRGAAVDHWQQAAAILHELDHPDLQRIREKLRQSYAAGLPGDRASEDDRADRDQHKGHQAVADAPDRGDGAEAGAQPRGGRAPQADHRGEHG